MSRQARRLLQPSLLTARHLQVGRASALPVRLFSNSTSWCNVSRNTVRPQLPFLSNPSSTHRGAWQLPRLLSFETKRWVKDGVFLGIQWGVITYVALGLGSLAVTAAYLEYIEYQYPTPREWSIMSRMKMRNVTSLFMKAKDPEALPEWPNIGKSYEQLLLRLEDPNIDGKLLKDQEEGGILVEGIGKLGYDVSEYGYEWRTGYYQCLMGAAEASQHLTELVLDRTRDLIFPANSVIGPDNPYPRPLPPKYATAPKAEDCDPFMPLPETFYMKVITTYGFTPKQKVDACIAYAEWLDRSGLSDSAEEMYQWAIDLSTASLPDGVVIKNHVIQDSKGNNKVPDNALRSLTHLGMHLAQHDKISQALPILVSILRARRQLGLPSAPEADISKPSAINPTDLLTMAREVLSSMVKERPYPPPDPSGEDPPVRTASEKCEEAKLMAYIGEILYVSSASHLEDGVSWTRDAIDLAEENFAKGGEVCQGCLEMAMDNWMTMVSQQAEIEKQKAETEPAKKSSWWFGETEVQQSTRWRSEEKEVVKRGQRISRLIRQKQLGV